MRRRFALALLSIAALACGSKKSAPPASQGLGTVLTSPPVVVDRVAAVVLGRPITLSEVELEARIARAASGNVEGAISGSLSAEERARMLEELVDRTSVLRGLRTLYPDTIDPRQADVEMERLRRAFPSEESWQRFLRRIELTEDEVRERRRRALEATAIVDAKLADVARVDADRLLEYMEKHGITDRRVAEERLLAEVADEIRRGIIADARRATAARIVPEDVH